uniref:N-acyl-aromatic-L-amino acid amidohydrolase n=2 Tax=Sinocyclocheilus rhinocerous TaxID=307959 RepID=A0A673IGJ3_9TELE
MKPSMALAFLPALARMAVSGGTHGNELSGVYVVQEMEQQRKETGEHAWPIPITTVLSNPRAVRECRRYIDRDINRCFNRATLSSPITDSSPYEVRRAQELNNLLGPKGSTDAMDLICDLHNTTANMGLTLIHYTTSDWVTLHICKYLQTKITKVPVRVLVLDVPISDAYSLESVSKHGFSIEVGPQPHGVVRADIYTIMKEAVDLTIDWIHKFNSGTVFEGGDVEAFKFIKSVDYPRDPETRTLTAAIHPQLQDRDFCLLKRGDPLFLSFSGETVKYEEEPLHPFFINEAAYYEKEIAFHLGKKMMLTIPSVQVQKD